MNRFSYYVGLDVHRKSTSYCVLLPDGKLVREGKVASTREDLEAWARTVPGPWCGGLEATICSPWIYWRLRPYAAEMKMAQPAKLKATSAAKRKNDTLDARTLANLLRCDLFPACYVLSPEHGMLRRQLRYRSFLVRMEVMLKNKAAGMLIESGVLYDTGRLHGKKYFHALLDELDPELKLIYEAHCAKGPKSRAILEVARRLVRRLLAIDRRHAAGLATAAA
jgi:hypothetical protein